MTMSSVLRGAASDNVPGVAGAALCAVLPGASEASAGGNLFCYGTAEAQCPHNP